MKKFSIGDVVVIKDTSRLLSLYKGWADLHDLKNFENGKIPNKDAVVTVKCVGFHGRFSNSGEILYGVTDGKNDYIIDEAGLEKHVEYEWQWLIKLPNGWYDTTYFYKTKEEVASTLADTVTIVSRIEESKREVVR